MTAPPPVSPAATGGPAPAPLGIERALDKLAPLNVTDEPATDAILFSGHRQEVVPRALFLDKRLTPLERNTWQIIRMMLNADGVTVFPTYSQLRPYLASVPCSDQASDETVARALTLLRLARWLTLVRHRRDSVTGRIKGNLYVLHDEPLTPFESIQLDPRYLELVSCCLTHASKAIQRVGYYALKEVTEDPKLSGRILPSRLEGLIERLANQGWTQSPQSGEGWDISLDVERDDKQQSDLARAVLTSDSEAGISPPSDSEEGTKPLKVGSLRNPKVDSTVRTDLYIKEDVRSVPRNVRTSRLLLPQAFHRLRAEQQAAALAALQRVTSDLQQQVLDEWAARCTSAAVRNPTGYLFGLIQKAMRGEFRAWASQRSSPELSGHSPGGVTDTSKELAQQHIAQLRAMLNIP